MKWRAYVFALVMSLLSPSLLWAGEAEQPTNGTITGQVLDAATGAAIANHFVYAYSSSPYGYFYVQTDASGVYTLSVPPGTYGVYSWGTLGYVTQVYPGINCTSCDVTGGTPVVVTSGTTTTSINFNLAQGGRIAGYVRNEFGQGMPDVEVDIYDSNGASVDFAYTDSAGAYINNAGLMTGSYYARTRQISTYIDEAYGGEWCYTDYCDVRNFSFEINVTIGVVSPEIDFDLDLGTQIRGHIIDQPVDGRSADDNFDRDDLYNRWSTYFSGNAYLYSYAGQLYFENYGGYTSANVTSQCAARGDFDVVVDLDLASWQWGSSVYLTLDDVDGWTGITRERRIFDSSDVYTFYSRGQLINLHFDDFSNASPKKLRLRRVRTQLEALYWNGDNGFISMGTAAVPGNDTAFKLGMDGVDGDAQYNVVRLDNFVLAADAISCGIPDVEVTVKDEFSGTIRYVYTDAHGRYASPALPDGLYKESTLNWRGFIDEAWDNIICVNCWNDEGDTISVSTEGYPPRANFQLDRGAYVTGRVTDVSGNPVTNVSVDVYDDDNTYLVYGYTDANGYYTTRALPSGQYYAVAAGFSPAYRAVLYNGQPCEPSCDPNNGDAMELVQPDAFTADFVLTPIGQISGNVAGLCSTPVCFSFPLGGVTVQIHNSDGTVAQTVTTDSSGHYSAVDLPSGTYYVRTVNNGGLIDQLYSGIMCLLNCNPVSGTPIVISAGTNFTANFLLSPGARLSGRVTNQATGAAIGFTYITVYDSANVAVASATADFNGNYSTSAFPPGTVHAITSSPWPFVNEAWNNINCPACIPNTTTAINAPAGVTGGINFTLILGGFISGTVSSGGLGVPGTSVYFHDSTGAQVLSAPTEALSGFYITASRLPPGNYFVRTSGAPAGIVDELYNNIPCDPTCTVTAGTPVAALADSETANINFDLSSLGTISGTVTNAASSAPLSGIEVRLYTGGGVLSTTTTTDAAGLYTFPSLSPALYYVRTAANGAYFDEIFNDVSCPATCQPLSGTGILVAAGVTQTANFGLAPGARISGRVTDVSTGTGLANAGVKFYNVLGHFMQAQTTDANGYYTTTQAMPSGTYYAVTINTGGYIDELYGDIVWDGATPGGSPISATVGATTANINFALGVGGRISGTVTRAADGTAVIGASVDIYDASGAFRTSGVTDEVGYYLSQAGLPAASYFARTSGTTGLVNERFDNTPCLGCSPALGTPIPVTVGATTELINFDLAAGATIAGTVRDNANANALANVTIKLWDSTGRNVANSVTDASGNYSIQGLPAASYFLSTDNALGYVNEAYDNVTCLTCAPTSVGSAIVLLTGGSATANISLVRGGSILGRVTSTSGGAGVGGVTVRIYSSTGQLVTTGVTDAGGFYGSRAGLTTGDYYLTTSNQSGFVDELYNNVVCLGCTNVTSGTAVAVTLGNNTPNIDFALTPGGRITGTVKDASLVSINATVMIYSSSGVLVTSGVTTTTGSYLTDAGLTTGNYYARTINNRGFIDQRYSGTTCHNPCTEVTSGTPIAVTIGNTTNSVNFTLAPGGRISGRVTDDPVTTTFGGVGVNIYSAGGQFVSSTTTDTNGVYITSGLPSANYFARSANALGFIDELYDGQTCFGCTIQAGTPIPVVVGQTAANRNFSLGVLGGRVSGRVTSSVNGAGIPNVEVRLFNDIGLVSVLTDATGNYVTPGVPAGLYREIASPATGFDTRLYNDIPCAGCDLSTGATISVAVGAVTAGINFVLHPLDPSVTLSAYAFEGSGHTVTATIQNGPGHRYDWVALFPVNNSNTGFVAGPVYLNGLATPPAVGLSTAQVTFAVPTSPGLYNVRLISALGPALALSGSITVTSQPTVTLSTLSVPAGGPVVATIANGPAYRYDYVGFYPVGNSNSGYIDWKYMNGQQSPPANGMPNANLQFITPSDLPPGQYNVRLIAVSGITASSPTLTVTPPPTVSVSSTTIAAGSSLTATIANGPGSRFDHVGFYPINNGPTGFITFKYLSDTQTAPAVGMTGATVSFTTAANLAPGQYNVRLRAAAGNVLAVSTAITVTPPPAISGTPASVPPGANINMTVTNGPGNRYDWVGLFPVANGDTGFVNWYYLNGTQTAPAVGVTTASFPYVAPGTLGQYNLRLFSASGTKLATSGPITVTNPPAVALSTTSAVSGSSVTASISNGPGSRFTWVGIFPVANGNTGFLELKYLNGTTTPPATGVTAADVLFTMPATAGQYNIRLFDPNSSTPIATSATITVTNTSAIALSATSVAVGATVTATISGGPGNRYNWAGLFPIANGNTGYVESQYLNGLSTPPAIGVTGAALTFTMPATPGQYNIRFFPHDSSMPLRTSATITVAAAPTLVPLSTTVTAGTTITATAAGGPGARWDWVGLFPIANSNTGFINMRYLNDSLTAPAVGVTGGTVNFPAPLTPGQYNLRFFYTYGGGTPIATSVTVTVTP